MRLNYPFWPQVHFPYCTFIKKKKEKQIKSVIFISDSSLYDQLKNTHLISKLLPGQKAELSAQTLTLIRYKGTSSLLAYLDDIKCPNKTKCDVLLKKIGVWFCQFTRYCGKVGGWMHVNADGMARIQQGGVFIVKNSRYLFLEGENWCFIYRKR